ncbi:MAG: NUDIX hydrolase [Pseudomonadota bacterium]
MPSPALSQTQAIIVSISVGTIPVPIKDASDVQTLAAGKYLELVKKDHWEWARRPSSIDAVCIVATDWQDRLLLVEQYRYPLDARTIELPAGLVGDDPGTPDEAILAAAKRELEEETGYTSQSWRVIGPFASSAGMTSETPTLVQARDCRKTAPGGGVDDEDITPHAVATREVWHWVRSKQQNGFVTDARVLAALAIVAGLADRPA